LYLSYYVRIKSVYGGVHDAQQLSRINPSRGVSQNGASSAHEVATNPIAAACNVTAASSSTHGGVGEADGAAVGAKDGGRVTGPVHTPPAQLVAQLI